MKQQKFKFLLQTLLIDISKPLIDLDNEEVIVKCLNTICENAKLDVLKTITHKFPEQGLSVAFILGESHINYQSWPELKKAYIDITSCKKIQKILLLQILQETFLSSNITIQEIPRQ
jgi:S-adenosylmethionine/arginine decarboxylase-like enzyme